ncbi:hypothetical protein ACHAXT_008325 [Thalassiosira profunda]
MKSGGSVSVAATAKASGSGPMAAANKNANKMKLDMPPRPAKKAATAARQQTSEPAKGKDAASVPHVVRVTFLGVAGLQAKPSNVQQSEKATEEGSSSQPIPPTASPASADHASLLLPLPPNMRVVASVSRSRTARGIPSGMSRPLSSIREKQKPTANAASSADSALEDELVSHTGESIRVVAKQSATALAAREGSLYDDTHQKVLASRSSSGSLAPPSSLLHKQSRSSQWSVGSASESTKEGKPPPSPSEGIEVVRPQTPSEGESKDGKSFSFKGNKEEGTDAEPERLVAVWDEGKRPPPSKPVWQQPRFVNQTNSLAFEADLRPSVPVPPANVGSGRTTPVASTNFAPKSFTISVGLVPNFEEEDGSGANSFAIPVGFADLVINGEETLDGKRKQVDLPLSSLGTFLGIGASANRKCPFPLIELTMEGLPGANSAAKEKDDAEAAAATEKGKKKNRFKRIFSREQQQAEGTADNSGAKVPPTEIYDGPTPKSIFDLDRAPNAKERTLFLERYGVDPAGDAVVRVGLEVFQRGSELEKIFRQKNKLRKKKAAERKKSLSINTRDRSVSPSVGSMTADSRGSMTADSRSLIDGESDSDDDSVYSQSFFTFDSRGMSSWDESTVNTDAMSSFNTGTIGDDTLSYTTEFTERNSPKTSSESARNLLANMLSCRVPVCGRGLDDVVKSPESTKDEKPYARIDTVVSAVASMSMAEPGARDDAVSPLSGVHGSRSMDTAEMGKDRPMSPDSVKESGEELTLGNSNLPPPPLDTAASLKVREASIDKEATPLATLQQAASTDLDEASAKTGERGGEMQVNQGQELTLEEDLISI